MNGETENGSIGSVIVYLIMIDVVKFARIFDSFNWITEEKLGLIHAKNNRENFFEEFSYLLEQRKPTGCSNMLRKF